MAKKRSRDGIQNTSKVETRSFTKGMIKDLNEGLMSEGAYVNARNAVNNSISGDLGIIANESSNLLCTQAPYTVIGAIHLTDGKWAIFSTDNINSEIGVFDELACEYTTTVNAQCLNFNKAYPIIGESKERFDCTRQIYWADALNPDRTMTIENPPWVQNCQTIDDCQVCVDTSELDCEALRIAKLTTPPCIHLETAPTGGELLNGTYFVCMAYTENEQRITDYSLPSNKISLFDHRNVNGAIDVVIDSIDQTYEEFELVVVGFVNQQLVARRVGIYSTRQGRIAIDRINPEWTAVPLELLPLDRPAYEKSEGIYRNGDYLLRVAPTSRFSFNYQPLANQIRTQWAAVEYPTKYYRKAGSNVGYLRDEVYSFFIRWVYNTGDKSEDYHIPGRAALPGELATVTSDAYQQEFFFEANNTAATVTSGSLGTTSDGGLIVAKGDMGYWESSETYPDNKPDVWDTLCGKNIRHHKMPDNEIINHYNSITDKIVILGVEFSNIAPPVDNSGTPIPGIIGYEILRGSREGNKTVVAKGLLNNMGKYEKRGDQEPAYYQNYPYNSLLEDPFLSEDRVTGDQETTHPLGGDKMQRDKFTFHSPDTQFKHPFLSAKEIKIYETVYGVQNIQFEEPELHPKHIILSDLAFWIAALVGFGTAIVNMMGTKKTTATTGSVPGLGWAIAGVANGGSLTGTYWSTLAGAGGSVGAYGGASGVDAAGLYAIETVGGFMGDLSTANATRIAGTGTAVGLGTTAQLQYSWDTDGASGMPIFIRAVQAFPTFANYWGEGTNTFLRAIKAFSKYRQHALAIRSHVFHRYSDYTYANTRTGILEAAYIDDSLQKLGDHDINNIYRTPCVGILTGNYNEDPTVLPDPPLAILDNTRATASQVHGPIDKEFDDKIGQVKAWGRGSAHYVGLKQRLRNQYGQLESIRRIPASDCTEELVDDPMNPGKYISSITFGGDTYIGRYTEKNTFYYFYDWLQEQPNGFEYDYTLKDMVPFATYWMNTKDFQINDFFNGIFNGFDQGGGSSTPPAILPSGLHNFDRGVFDDAGNGTSNFNLTFTVKAAYMYLFNSGVRDFYVESEVNVEYRDWGDLDEEKHYDPYRYTSLNDLFHQSIIKAQPYFKYDYSLSVGRLYQFFPSWSQGQYRNYDPAIAETCYTYYPKRVIYSLPQNKELRYDNWLTYLVNNYKDFTSKVTAIESISKNGAIILFEKEAPIQFLGVDQLETGAGNKITIGDGGLFSQPLQNIVNANVSYEYGSCQNRLSVINTPAGLFWISQDQGKIFQYAGSLSEISQNGMKWWFEEFLPYKLTEDFPDFELTDNTIVGIGCQTIYDNSNGIIYFCKRDYKVKPEWASRVTYEGEDNFRVDIAPIKLGDPRYFDDASWTVSYDPKIKAWVSFHDWHPNLLLPSKNDFISILNDGFWKHNDRSDSYCNFYGVDYPFEVEMVTPTGQTVNTLKSVEYMMEVFIYGPDGVDRHHALDFNFDRAILYNTEQISGNLNLTLTPKNNAPAILNYPQVNPNSIDILYSKEEQKYRFNQFWDITDDRGESTTARRLLWLTEPNGYVKQINPFAVNYAKPLFERKKFRHYQSNLLLRRSICGEHHMQLKVVNSKNQYSMR